VARGEKVFVDNVVSVVDTEVVGVDIGASAVVLAFEGIIVWVGAASA